jgi:hypothetical protein
MVQQNSGYSQYGYNFYPSNHYFSGKNTQQEYPYSTSFANPYFQGPPAYNGYTPSDTGIMDSTQSQPSTQKAPTPEPPLNDSVAVARLQVISSDVDTDKDGKLSVEELRQAMQDKTGKYSKKDKAALQYLLDNQNGLRGRLDQFDGDADGSFAVDTLNQVVADPNAKPGEEMSNTDALLILKGHLESLPRLKWRDRDRGGKKDENRITGISRDQLAALENDDSVSQEVRDAAKKILENEELFKAADTGSLNDGNYNGHISYQDVKLVLGRSNLDSIGRETSANTSSGQSVIQTSSTPLDSSYPPVSTGNANLDYYYNSVYNPVLVSATDIYRQVG